MRQTIHTLAPRPYHSANCLTSLRERYATSPWQLLASPIAVSLNGALTHGRRERQRRGQRQCSLAGIERDENSALCTQG